VVEIERGLLARRAAWPQSLRAGRRGRAGRRAGQDADGAALIEALLLAASTRAAWCAPLASDHGEDVIAHSQQVVRTDPDLGPASPASRAARRGLEEEIARADGLIVSDYGKGSSPWRDRRHCARRSAGRFT
jgi:bifunctional ADP-heptose synthase (sugar kinase/adenylyltransferase)